MMDWVKRPDDMIERYLMTVMKWVKRDEFASLPAIVPKGPIAIFGLGGGTTARLMLDLWPSLQLEGWEIDEILIDKAREYLGLSDLEKRTVGGGILNVHIGDVLSQSVNASGGYAGIVIDLFSGGKVLPQLQEVKTWLEFNDRLMPNGRLMVNCGGIDEASNVIDGVVHPKNSSIDGTWVQNSTIKALSKAFPGKVGILP
uniref:PABS domain-containing protein n=1 Tax=Fagus sylvatica TaxID=28930 RepID=A0A2N9H2X9_FAGSY